MSKYSIVIRFFLVPVIAVVILTVLFGAPVYGKLERLAKVRGRGNNANASVIAKHCDNHGTVDYEFTAKGIPYQSHSNSCFAHCKNVAIGDHLNVWYLEDDPASVECGDLNDKIENQIIGLALLSIALVMFAAACLWKCMVELKGLKADD